MVFTHGFGITIGPVSRISKEGLPEFIIKDIPPVSSADIGRLGRLRRTIEKTRTDY